MTLPFETTPEQKACLPAIGAEMPAAGVDDAFVIEASQLARRDQGIFDLMGLWVGAASDTQERNAILSDLRECLADYAGTSRSAGDRHA